MLVEFSQDISYDHDVAFPPVANVLTLVDASGIAGGEDNNWGTNEIYAINKSRVRS